MPPKPGAHCIPRWIALVFTLVGAAPLFAADPGNTTIPLFEPAPGAAGRSVVRADALPRLRSLAPGARVIVLDVPMSAVDPGVDLVLERFAITSAQTRFVAGPDRRPLDVEPDRVVLLRGHLAERPAARVFLAVSDLGIAGTIDCGSGGGRFVLTGEPGAPAGLARGPVRFVPAATTGALPPVPFCATETHEAPAAASDAAGWTGRRRLLLAIDTDYEYFRLFDDLDAAGAYIVALYGAVSDVFLRDTGTAIQLGVVRLWDQPENLYDGTNPLFALADEWNGPLALVPRAAVQLLTARRNLPYGGVAWLDGLCMGSAYSVAGWINGRFVDPVAPHAGNWDLVVAAHELGHTCGARHTHDLGIDSCDEAEERRGSLMSYCHLVPGGIANIDLRFHTESAADIIDLVTTADCTPPDCNGNGIDDAQDILFQTSIDLDGNGIPDECEDCNGNMVGDAQDISSGTSFDLDGNGIPDECEPDCNLNGVPDALDIALGTSTDAYGDGIPDECELDANANRVSDYTEIQSDMTLDIDRNARLDATEDCDGDGVSDRDELGDGLNLWVTGAGNIVREFHRVTGVAIRDAAAPGLGPCADIIVGPDRRLYLSRAAHDSIGVIDPVTGDFLGDLVPPGRGGLSRPGGLAVTPWGSLVVASRGTDAVLEYALPTGAFVRALVPSGAGDLVAPHGLAFSADGRLIVSSERGAILHFDGRTGTFLGPLVPATVARRVVPRGILVTPDGRLLVTDFEGDRILMYDVRDGTPLGRFDRGGPSGSFWSLRKPVALRLSVGGDTVYAVSSAGNAAIQTYALDDGLFTRSAYVLALGIAEPTALAIMPAGPGDCNANGRPDDCDLLTGESLDLNRNGIPDECESSTDLEGQRAAGLVRLLADWGPCARGCPSDRTGDGRVDARDLVDALEAWPR